MHTEPAADRPVAVVTGADRGIGRDALTRLLAGELRRDGVLVNAVCPGWTDTDMGRGGRPVAQGAASVVWAAVPGDGGPTGGFFRDGRSLPC